MKREWNRKILFTLRFYSPLHGGVFDSLVSTLPGLSLRQIIYMQIVSTPIHLHEIIIDHVSSATSFWYIHCTRKLAAQTWRHSNPWLKGGGCLCSEFTFRLILDLEIAPIDCWPVVYTELDGAVSWKEQHWCCFLGRPGEVALGNFQMLLPSPERFNALMWKQCQPKKTPLSHWSNSQ